MTWRDTIIENFIIGINRLTLVSDPDGLFSDAELRTVVEARGFFVLEFHEQDWIKFRHEYETQFRARWDNGENVNLAVIFSCDINALPFDLVQNSRKLHFSLAEIFPSLPFTAINEFEFVIKNMPDDSAKYPEWLNFAAHWAELSAFIHSQTCELATPEAATLKTTTLETATRMWQEFGLEINKRFSKWLSSNYASLISLPASNPVMVHHIPRRLAREIEVSKSAKAALIAIDGLSFDQWITVRRVVHSQNKNLLFQESGLFAWIPNLTNVSRVAIFAGKKPSDIATLNTGAEAKLWRDFWSNYCDAEYVNNLRCDAALAEIPQARVLGIVVSKIDKIMHGMELGSAGMHKQIEQWMEGGFLGRLITTLLDAGYDVWLTSDHGNIECRGVGRPSEGGVADLRGERARIYSSNEVRSRFAADFNFAEEWQPVGLPQNYYPLLISGREAFTKQGEKIVAHGGISLEEVIVPFIKVERISKNEQET